MKSNQIKMNNVEENVVLFEKDLGYRFKNRELIKSALTHPSYAKSSFEILEFMGDRVLNLIVSKILYESTPANEKEYAHKFMALTNKEALCQAGFYMKLDQYVVWSGESVHQKTIIQDAVEAVVGAIFLDAGLDFTYNYVASIWALLKQVDFQQFDPKSSLQVFLNSQKLNYRYDLIKTSGPPHNRRYMIKLWVENCKSEFFGFGSSVRAAEKDAASKFLKSNKDER